MSIAEKSSNVFPPYLKANLRSLENIWQDLNVFREALVGIKAVRFPHCGFLGNLKLKCNFLYIHTDFFEFAMVVV